MHNTGTQQPLIYSGIATDLWIDTRPIINGKIGRRLLIAFWFDVWMMWKHKIEVDFNFSGIHNSRDCKLAGVSYGEMFSSTSNNRRMMVVQKWRLGGCENGENDEKEFVGQEWCWSDKSRETSDVIQDFKESKRADVPSGNERPALRFNES